MDKDSFRKETTVTINRNSVDSNGIETSYSVDIGRFYFEATWGISQCSFQIFINEEITDEGEKKQIQDLYKTKYLEFVANSNSMFGWGDILDVTKTEPII